MLLQLQRAEQKAYANIPVNTVCVAILKRLVPKIDDPKLVSLTHNFKYLNLNNYKGATKQTKQKN